jgi:hypothetical protein
MVMVNPTPTTSDQPKTLTNIYARFVRNGGETSRMTAEETVEWLNKEFPHLDAWIDKKGIPHVRTRPRG